MPTATPSSLEIAQAAQLRPIAEIAAAAGLEPGEVDLYGTYKAKVSLSVLDRLAGRSDGKLVCVSAITPTKFGEGKTTTAVSLTQGLGAIGRKPVLCLREASLGPVFGIKGGAAGAGRAQVVPMEDMNLHFTGDIHAIGAANNLLAALLEAHLLHGNELGIDPLSVSWRRCIDINDRALRDTAVGLGGRANGYPRQTGCDITAASEVMAIVAVASDLRDLRARLGRDHGRQRRTGRRARHRGAAEGGRRDDRAAEGHDQAEPRADTRGTAGIRPLRPLREHRARQQLPRRRPRRAQARRRRRHRVGLRRRHGHGEVLRHRLPRRRADAECRRARGDGEGAQAPRRRSRRAAPRRSRPARPTSPATSGSSASSGSTPSWPSTGSPADTDEEIEQVRRIALANGAFAAEANEAVVRGGEGATELAEAVVAATDEPSSFAQIYALDDSIERKIETIATRVYGADGILLQPAARERIAELEQRRASAACRSAWRRPTSRSRTTRRSPTRRPASP